MKFVRPLTGLSPAICIVVFLVFRVATLQAAENVTENAIDRTIIATLKPIIGLFSGNAWLQGAAVILVTFTVASFVTWLLFKFLLRITTRTRIGFDDEVVVLLRPPVYYSFLVSGISYGLRLMPLSESIHQIGTRSIHTLGVVVWIIFFTRFASLVLIRLSTLTTKFSFIERRTLTLFDNVAKVLIFAIGIYAIFVIWKIDMTAWLASAGIAGIAVGFAAKDTLSNLFSGVFILADAPYKVGDYIVLDRGERGKIIHIGLRSTRILTRDDVEVTIPNSIIGNSTIINQSGGPSEKLRIRVKVGVAYGTDIDQVREMLLEIARHEPLICTTPDPSVRFRLFGASSLDLELRGWVSRPELRGRATDALNSKIYRAFTQAGIEIPYTKQDLYIKGLPAPHGVLAAAEYQTSVSGDPR